MQKRRTFLTTCGDGHHWLIQETLCESCGESDVDLDSPVENEERGARYITGTCAGCGSAMRCDVFEIDFHEPRAKRKRSSRRKAKKLSAPRPRNGRGRPRRRAARKARRRAKRRAP